jgi:lysine biosynthesis protein LysW
MRFSLRIAQKVTCPNCWAYLEVVSLNPLRLSWDAGEYEEVWDEIIDREDDW